MNRKNLATYSVLFLHLIAIILYHIYGYIGHYGYDDLHLAQLSSNLLNGIVDFEDHFTYRLPIILTTSLSYYLFGISDFSSSFPTLMVSFSILFIVFWQLKNKGLISLFIGLSLTTFSNWFIFYSDKLMPDIYVAFFVTLSLVILHKYKYNSDKKRHFLYSVLLATSLLFGFMTKGTIVLILPLLMYYFILDLVLKRDIKFWINSLVVGIVLISFYFIMMGLLTGDYMKRFNAIAANSYLNLCSYTEQSIKILINRISFEFFTMLIHHGMIIAILFVVSIFFRKKSLAYFKLNDSFSFFVVSSLILFLSSNFMTISLTSYAPMCLDPRHYLFLTPIAAIPAAIIITQFVKEKQYSTYIIIALTIVSIISFFLETTIFWKLYLPLLTLFVIYVFVSKNPIYQNLFVILLSFILILKPFEMITYAQKINYKKQKEIFLTYLLNKKEPYTIITNEVQKRLGRYFNKFDNDKNLRLVNYKEFYIDTANTNKKILFLNRYTRYLSGYDVNDLPYYAKNISTSNKVIYKDNEMGIAIYEMINFSIPELKGDTLLHTINDFEELYLNWHQNNNDISTEVNYAGERSIKVIEYSSTFEYPLDSLQMNDASKLLINCDLHCYFEDKTNSKIVISIENNEGNPYIWESLPVNKYLKAYSNWWPVNYNIEINAKDLKKDARLKIYLWNIDKKTAYIDNFEVSITGIKN